jgi:HemK-related putative methylase
VNGVLDAPAITTAAALPFALACPLCRGGVEVAGGEARCAACGRAFPRRDGVWRFLPDSRAGAFAAFLREYETVRAAEGWGAPDPAYYLALPRVAADDPQRDIWRLRATSHQALLDRVVRPLERSRRRPLTVLDLGAGNCWLAHRLAGRGHRVAAVDLSTSTADGLGAHVRYADGETAANSRAFVPMQAEFDRLPFADGQFDLVIFNASLHYSTDYHVTLREATRVLRRDGRLVVMDSPVYRDAESGARMVRDREARFNRQHGFPSNALPCEGYLTHDRLAALAAAHDLRWQTLAAAPRWRRARHAWKDWIGRLRGRREPAQFPVLVGARAAPALLSSSYPAAVRSAWRLVLRWRFRLFQRHRHDRLVLERVHGRPILVLPHVFNPKLLRTGEFLVGAFDALLVPPGSTALDLGTGSGVGAVFAAQWAGRVVAADINPAAVRCARINALLNRVEDRVEAREGDLFAPVRDERFDVVLFNPPYFRGTPRDALDRAWRATDVVESFAAELPDHLAPGGHALVVLSSDGEARSFLATFAAAGLTTAVVARRDLINETLTVYRLTPEVRSAKREA